MSGIAPVANLMPQPSGLRVGTGPPDPAPPSKALPAQEARAEDVRLYNERMGAVPGQGRVIGLA